MAGAGEKDKYNKNDKMQRKFVTVPRKRAAGPKRKTSPVKPGLIAGPAPKLTPKAMPKKKAMGGPTGKPKPKYDSNGKRILTGTGSVTKNQRMPELKRPGGISGAATKKVAPKVGAKAGSAAGGAKATPKAAPKFSAKMNQANPGKGMSAGSFAKKVVMNFPPVALAAAGVKARLASVKKNEKFKMDTAKNSKPKSTAAKNKTMALNTPKISKKGM